MVEIAPRLEPHQPVAAKQQRTLTPRRLRMPGRASFLTSLVDRFKLEVVR